MCYIFTFYIKKTINNKVLNSGGGVNNLGCPENVVDSERILTQLRAEGYDVTNRYDDAELVIVNTCGFID
jgi:ribosomal protein S12 methylthiotransferase